MHMLFIKNSIQEWYGYLYFQFIFFLLEEKMQKIIGFNHFLLVLNVGLTFSCIVDETM
jgi:hypothetical protein